MKTDSQNLQPVDHGGDVKFAGPSDYAECKRLHKRYGTTYYFASQLFPPEIRRRVHALYGFFRVPDEWVDDPGETPIESRKRKLAAWRGHLIRGLDGVRPDEPVLRAFCDVVHETAIPIEEPLLFLDAMEQDITVDRYATFADLQGYMRGSAASVGVMMCYAIGAVPEEPVLDAARSMGEAMQLTNFIRDIGEDASLGRIYLPLEDLEKYHVDPQEIMDHKFSDRLRTLITFEIECARSMYKHADKGIPLLPDYAQKPVRLARELYSRILDHIEAGGCDVFATRARTGRLEKLSVAASVLLKG